MREDIETELKCNDLCKGAAPVAIITGDFNSDCNDPEMFPESAGFPNKALDGKTLHCESSMNKAKNCFYDVWKKIDTSYEGSQTESHKHNAFPAWLKPSQKREATFDRIVVAQCVNDDSKYVQVGPISIELIGNRKIGAVVADKNRDVVSGDNGADGKETVELFSSDHFGLVSRLRTRLVIL